ncbi:MAG: PTS mannose/fructose/sorbose transporter subunit IIB [Deltaproteobacteria bacterium]|nr:PTS mannose/fructose/sorbose transporter subunit IIB [Deltaproteobacteria bacterium]
MMWVRIDNRLVHGQVIEGWVPYVRARALCVANDELSVDPLRQEIMGLAVSSDLDLLFSRVAEAARCVRDLCRRWPGVNMLILFASCTDARRAYEDGLEFSQVNVGNLHYAPGKRQLCSHVAVSQEDVNCLNFFVKKGLEVDFRCVPNKPVHVSW